MEEMPKPHALPGKDRAEKSCQFKGIRFRKWGSWVCEIRIPRSRQKLWLGSYKTAERAARSYDAALYCLRGPNAIFNFPGSVPNIPSASSLSRHQIKLAAAKHAHMDPVPSISPSAHNNDENGSANKEKKAAARKDSVSSSRPASAQERVSLSDGRHQQEDELALLWESLLPELGDCLTQSLEQLPSIEEEWALNPMPSPIPSWEEQHHEQYEEEDMSNFLQLTDPWALNPIPSPITSWEEQQHEQYEEEDMNNFLQLTDLWNFGDV